VGALPEDYKKLVAILELIRVEEFIPSRRFCKVQELKK
jgi:hypothetical protein